MSLSEMTFEWLATVLLGLVLTCAPTHWVFFPARLIRAILWMALLSLGAPVAASLRAISIAIGIIAALPLFSTLLPALVSGGELSSFSFQAPILVLVLLIRLLLLPGAALQWSRIRAWEQEVVRRPANNPFQLLFGNGTENNSQSVKQRLWSLSLGLSSSEFSRSNFLEGIPMRASGLLLLYASILLVPSSLKLSPEKLLAITQKIQLPVNIAQVTIISCVALLFFQYIRKNLKPTDQGGPALSSLPVGRRYYILRKIAEYGRWLTNPGNLATLFMQIDLLAATFRITLT
jgi:hypothetical protein